MKDIKTKEIVRKLKEIARGTEVAAPGKSLCFERLIAKYTFFFCANKILVKAIVRRIVERARFIAVVVELSRIWRRWQQRQPGFQRGSPVA